MGCGRFRFWPKCRFRWRGIHSKKSGKFVDLVQFNSHFFRDMMVQVFDGSLQNVRHSLLMALVWMISNKTQLGTVGFWHHYRHWQHDQNVLLLLSIKMLMRLLGRTRKIWFSNSFDWANGSLIKVSHGSSPVLESRDILEHGHTTVTIQLITTCPIELQLYLKIMNTGYRTLRRHMQNDTKLMMQSLEVGVHGVWLILLVVLP